MSNRSARYAFAFVAHILLSLAGGGQVTVQYINAAAAEAQAPLKVIAIGPLGPSIPSTLDNLPTDFLELSNSVERLVLEKRFLEAELILRLMLEESTDPTSAVGLRHLADKLYQLGEDEMAQLALKRSAAIWKTSSANGRPEHADALMSLAQVYHSRFRTKDAEPVVSQALSIYEAALGPDHPRLAFPLTALAVVKNILGQHAEVEILDKRIEAIEQVASQSAVVAEAGKRWGVHHLGNCPQRFDLHYSRKRVGRLEEWMNASLARHGSYDLNYAEDLFGFAQNFLVIGNVDKAEQLHLRALEIREKELDGFDHYTIASSLHELAEIYRLRADYAKAEEFHLRALQIRQTAPYVEDRDLAKSLNNLAIVYLLQGRFADAEPLFLLSGPIQERYFIQLFRANRGNMWADERCPAVAEADRLNNLAIVKHALGHSEEAEQLYRRSLDLFKSAVGPDDTIIEIVRSNLKKLTDPEGSEYYFGDFNDDKPRGQSAFADSHALYLENRCVIRRRAGRLEAALADCGRAIRLFNGNRRTYFHRAQIYRDMDMFDEAAGDFSEALNSAEETLVRTIQRQMKSEGLYAGSSLGHKSPELDDPIDRCIRIDRCYFPLQEVIGRFVELNG